MKAWAVGIAAIGASALATASFGASETIGVTLKGANGWAGSNYVPGLHSGLSITADLGSGNITNYDSAGAFRWRVNSDNDGSTFSGYVNSANPLFTFCLQLFQSTGSPMTVASLNSSAPLAGSDSGVIDPHCAAQIQGLVDAFWNKVDFTNSVPANYSFNSVSYTDNVVAAAFQLSIWEIEYDGGSPGESYNLNNATNYFGSGQLTVTGSGDGQTAIDLANAWLNSTAWRADSAISSYALESSSYQDQLYGIPNAGGSGETPVPLPASLPAGLCLFVGLAAYRKFRKSTA
jgi:hypothetical protein